MPEIKVKITAENADAVRKLDEVEEKGNGLGSRLGAAFGTMGKALVAGLAAAGAAMGAIGAQAFEAYGEFEQLAGGIDTLFGDTSGKVMENAANAFQTAGMSANQYMETVTGFSASLLQSLGGDTEAAAAYADMAIVDMSDNANKMGTSMESIQNAYQGFAKQNYTMLDNLRLGYGGTKQEMERLLSDAEAISGVHYDIDSYADVVAAIHVIQDEMGIAGTTAEEAATTIQGSMGMVSASWENLLVGLADPDADVDALVTQFTDSLSTLVTVATPVIEQIAQSFGTALPIIVPQLLQLATGIITTLLQTVLEQAPMLVESFVQAVQMVVEALPGMLPMLVEAAVALFLGLLTGLTDATPALLDGVTVAIIAIINQLPTLIPAMVAAAGTLFMAIVTAIVNNGPAILAALKDAINQLLQMVADSGTNMLVAFGNLMTSARQGIANGAAQLGTALRSAIQRAVQVVRGMVGQFMQAGRNLVEGIGRGIVNGASAVVNAAKDAAKRALDAAKSFLGIHSPSTVFRDQVGRMIVAGAVEGIEAGAGLFDAAVGRAFAFDLSGGGIALPGMEAPGIDMEAMGRVLASSIDGLAVMMDGHALVGQIVTDAGRTARMNGGR